MYAKPSIYIERIYNILVLEDMPSWQKRFRRFLQDEPFNVFIATNCLEALHLTQIYLFDLLILDINLSGVPYNVDGLRVADQLWGRHRNIKIIIVSGDQDWDRHLGIYGFVPRFILEKQSLDQDDFIRKVYQTLRY